MNWSLRCRWRRESTSTTSLRFIVKPTFLSHYDVFCPPHPPKLKPSMANPSLPSFVELMASLGLQDEHAANALLHGASGDTVPVPVVSEPPISNYRQSTASLDSSGTPLSTASLLTPLSSPSVQREQRERPTSHGKKRYSPYGLSTVVNGDVSLHFYIFISDYIFSHAPCRSTHAADPFPTFFPRVTTTADFITCPLQNHIMIIVGG